MTDGIYTEHEAAAHHGKGLSGALHDIPKWGWWAMGGAALILIIWSMRRSATPAANTAIDTGQTPLPTATDPTAGVGSGTGTGGTTDNTQALLDGFQQMESQQMDVLNQLMQGQAQAMQAAMDASTQQQMAAFQGLQQQESTLGDTLSSILSSLSGLSSSPVVNNPATSGTGYPGVGIPTAPTTAPDPTYIPPAPGIYNPPAPAPYTSGDPAVWAGFGYVWDPTQNRFVPGGGSSQGVQNTAPTHTTVPTETLHTINDSPSVQQVLGPAKNLIT